ncbi:PREDICTED: 28S ribosomal protein S31, mitochondrial [Elephantulus edwardii]|uniref:28S ribosomal protein S31, mitochondrial n=1 Tax=Elephantulus edwardii TaxID=28737 RepID=UPI0003F0A724|nr:PREDICTED: 28S ribosomal protein S31, mitochondrial [Elephantulus edwardii]
MSQESHRTKTIIQRYFGTNKKDEESTEVPKTSKEASQSKGSAKENPKQDLLNIIKGMKVELNTINVQTTQPPNRRPRKSLEITIGRLKKTTENSTKERVESLSPELVAAASAVADSLPFDKTTTKSELLRQLQKHEEEWKTQKERGRHQVSFNSIISDMKVAKYAAVKVSSQSELRIQFDEDNDFDYLKKKANLSKRKNIFQGKRLNIFDPHVAEEEPETEGSPSIWDIEFAKQLAALAAVTEQPIQNGFEEMIQWTKEGKLWEFPINNEAGFDDDGSEFHEHIFLDKHLEDFPKKGPIRHFKQFLGLPFTPLGQCDVNGGTSGFDHSSVPPGFMAAQLGHLARVVRSRTTRKCSSAVTTTRSSSWVPKSGKGKKKSKAVSKDLYISKMLLCGDLVIVVLRNPLIAGK